MKKIHMEILDMDRQNILKKLSKVLKNNYYLAGGTALALQLCHRESIDFDLFRNAEIDFSTKRSVLKEFRQYSVQTLVDTSDELSVVLNQEVKITLLNYFWDPIFPLVKISGLAPLLCIRDIATTKAYALGRRGNYRDYFDLYVILRDKHATLRSIIKWCQRKYGEIFSERMFLEQLTYFGDVEIDRGIRYLNEKPISPKELSAFFKNLIKQMLAKESKK